MGSPESEDWRSNDEMQHSVTIAPFYMARFEVTQKEWREITGKNPSNFSGKTIMPFCSHGGGRFGQSLTAIAKLAPKARLTEGLSVHYSGGNSLKKDVEKWLKKTGAR